jgi:hypothetical protein
VTVFALLYRGWAFREGGHLAPRLIRRDENNPCPLECHLDLPESLCGPANFRCGF